jgi:hypothetical protein
VLGFPVDWFKAIDTSAIGGLASRLQSWLRRPTRGS